MRYEDRDGRARRMQDVNTVRYHSEQFVTDEGVTDWPDHPADTFDISYFLITVTLLAVTLILLGAVQAARIVAAKPEASAILAGLIVAPFAYHRIKGWLRS